MRPIRLVSLGTFLPTNYVMGQEEVLDLLGYRSPLARRIFLNTGIKKRHFAMMPLGRSWQELREENPKVALELSLQAVNLCLDGRWSPKEIDLLVFCSVTDYNTPALGYRIAKALGLREDVAFTNIEGQGCQSLIPGIQRAYDFCVARGGIALVVNCEICSSTYFPSDENDLENVMTNSLFADGASAVLITSEDDNPEHPEILDFQSLYSPDCLDILGYTWVDGRLKCRLDRSVPERIPPLLNEAVRRLLSRNGLSVEDVSYWAIHPGGPAILRRVERLLGLTEEQTWASWVTLSEYGNVSSVTLALIAKKVRESYRGPGYAVGVTMGAGGSVEAMLCRFL